VLLNLSPIFTFVDTFLNYVPVLSITAITLAVSNDDDSKLVIKSDVYLSALNTHSIGLSVDVMRSNPPFHL